MNHPMFIALLIFRMSLNKVPVKKIAKLHRHTPVGKAKLHGASFNDDITYIKMESPAIPATNGEINDHHHDGVNHPKKPVNHPLTPVPAIDEIKPPLEATLGGDDVVIPLQKNNEP
jgi:hypothetical protein